mmetsp:Transcript_24789/g.74511  ORF Transcript_24789/g.74511 Transcript_24789/m.74511 type:complete len:325 (+) Transcript_24789:282-1256(+)
MSAGTCDSGWLRASRRQHTAASCCTRSAAGLSICTLKGWCIATSSWRTSSCRTLLLPHGLCLATLTLARASTSGPSPSRPRPWRQRSGKGRSSTWLLRFSHPRLAVGSGRRQRRTCTLLAWWFGWQPESTMSASTSPPSWSSCSAHSPPVHPSNRTNPAAAKPWWSSCSRLIRRRGCPRLPLLCTRSWLWRSWRRRRCRCVSVPRLNAPHVSASSRRCVSKPVTKRQGGRLQLRESGRQMRGNARSATTRCSGRMGSTAGQLRAKISTLCAPTASKGTFVKSRRCRRTSRWPTLTHGTAMCSAHLRSTAAPTRRRTPMATWPDA